MSMHREGCPCGHRLSRGTVPQEGGRGRIGFLWTWILVVGMVGLAWAAPLFFEALLKWGIRGLVLFSLWAFFFAQFLLPLERVEERLAMTWRVVAHALGWAGPVLMVQDGRILSRQDERLAVGPGLLVTDLASAVVLRTKLNYSRVVPPSSVAFLSREEYVEDVVDLRAISRMVGPQATEQPFAPQQPEEDEARYQERRARFYQTRGLTRDGVEVAARIWVKFHLREDEPARPSLSCVEGRLGRWRDREWRRFPPFRTIYHGTARAVWHAVRSRPLRADGPEDDEQKGHQRYPWDWLPAMMAAELWREYVRRFTLDELFTPLDQHDGQTGVEVIQQTIKARLTKNRYQDLDPKGNLEQGGKRTSLEYYTLREQGIAVENAAIVGLFFPPEVEKDLAKLRVNTWLQRAKVQREAAERQRALAQEEGERAALAFLGRSLRPFRPALQEVVEKLPQEQGGVALDAFFLGVANAVMADLAEAFDRNDLRERLGTREVGRLRKLLARLRSFMPFVA